VGTLFDDLPVAPLPRSLLLAAAAALALLGPACAGPCKLMEQDRRALQAPPATLTQAPHARVQIPFAIANRLIADTLQPPPELPVPLARLGPLAQFIGDVRAIPREVTLGPAGTPGRVRASARVELADRAGELLTVRASGDIAPIFERSDSEDHRLTIAFDAAQLSKLEPDLGPRAVEQLGALLQARLPEKVRDRFPRIVVERVAAAVVEEALEQGYRLMRETMLPRLRERARIHVGVPDVPLARVELWSTQVAFAVDIFTTLPVTAGVAPAPPATDEILVQIAGDTAARAANWGIARGVLPQRYTRRLKPDRAGAYVPHFEWRPGDPDRPLVVHMFRVEGGCAHFAVGVQPHVEVRDGKVDAWTGNRRLEQADGPLVLELLARTKALVERSTSSKKQGPGSVQIAVGGRELTTRLVRAEIAGDELRAAMALAIGPAGQPVVPPVPAPSPAPPPP
jgi:hypothetical protein